MEDNLLSRSFLSKSETKLETAVCRRSRILSKGAVLFTCGAQVDMKSWNVNIAVFQDIKQESRETRMFICCVYRRDSWTCLVQKQTNKQKKLARLLDLNFSTTVGEKWDLSEEVSSTLMLCFDNKRGRFLKKKDSSFF